MNEPYIIENLIINALVTEYGIKIMNSNAYFMIQHCTISNAYEGILLDTVNNSLIIDNNCSNNFADGIWLNNGNNNKIIHNIVNYGDEGIALWDCNNTVIYQNSVNYHDDDGIVLDGKSSDNNVTQNDVMNSDYGIHIIGGSFNNITSNTVGNSKWRGIYLSSCHENLISSNVVNNSGQYGIYLWNVNDTYIHDNVLKNNIMDGIYIDSGYIDNGSTNNLIYRNFFLVNGRHAYDDGTNNDWNSTTIGNYWDNHAGPDLSPQDGIVDTPYNITGSAGSIDYLPIAINSAPVITINWPKPNELDGMGLLDYDISITDPYLFEMWYTLDGGLHNYTITEFTGYVDQSAWNLLNSGIYTVRFYASDKAGNIGYSEVQIEKDVTPPSINIVSPTLNAKFSSAPNFVVEISDAKGIYSMWYSLDGGVTNYRFTSNGTIDSIAWAALSNGSVNITFYANDILWNLASQSVTVIKSVPSGIDPVLLAGGVVIAAGIYIFMRRRSRT